MSNDSDGYYAQLAVELDIMWRPYYGIAGCGLPFVLFLGIIDNIMSIVALSRSASLGSSVRLYYMTITVLDLIPLIALYLFNYYMSDGVQYFLPYNNPLNSAVYSAAGCKLAFYLGFSAEISCNWVYVSFSLERLFFVAAPMKARRVMTTKISVACVAIVISSCWLEALIFLLYQIQAFSGTFPYCLFNAPNAGSEMSSYLMFCGYLVAPLTNMIVCFVILSKLKRAAEQRQEMGKGSAANLSATVTILIISSIHSTIHATFGFAKCTWLINRVVGFLRLKEATRIEVAYNIVAELLITATHSTNFFIYLFRITDFRQALCGLKKN